ncbi:MAG: carboxylating nicotinate-nucleotide diphosphorylase [Desulfomicrobium sp.]|nr:carboxylating nicotinate-nucleotide diphosphorylase [Pseudomonadota bacterium]MBV1711039.1 carboxylating nicotinate-nucleotide diphosphorylase [Desulfomicrobium sp.]MBU4570693.1 carboxylating nicotinate-nucleotide diphosphorylase [Pseudomonadota bacterium]MBU4593457.1 carboxylating nicotinate-nucleotide diphosphorylase [Pseudomonadota bacterium]MBV1719229.1 carboxylating nicotinate-nucleotide diphosphorylase [Desulfomicrobium sp.]
MFSLFFDNHRCTLLHRLVDLALEEDGRDLTSEALFPPTSMLHASITAKEETLVAGLPLIGIVLERTGYPQPCVTLFAEDGEDVQAGREVARIKGPAPILLKAERVIMNFICHLSGVANATRRFVRAVEGTGVRVLDTRKTTPGQRYLEKYAVRLGGGHNHRLNLEEMLMLKDNHIDQAGSITAAVDALRAAYAVCPPLEIECRTLDDVREAVALSPQRIMLDNMPVDTAAKALSLIPGHIESEISGNVTLATIRALAELRPTYISTGAITHSAPVADFSMRLTQSPREDA